MLVAVVGYRLAPKNKFPSAWQDVASVTRFFGAHAHDYGGNPTAIAVGGEGAGGNLAAAAGLEMLGSQTSRPGPTLCLQLLVYPMLQWGKLTESMIRSRNSPAFSTLQMIHAWSMYLANPTTDAQLSRASVMYAPSKALRRLSPVHMISAEADVLCSEGEMYINRLRDHGVNVTSTLYPGVPFGFFADPRYHGGAQSLDEAAAVLGQRCKSAPSFTDEMRKATEAVQSGSFKLDKLEDRRQDFRERARGSGPHGALADITV